MQPLVGFPLTSNDLESNGHFYFKFCSRFGSCRLPCPIDDFVNEVLIRELGGHVRSKFLSLLFSTSPACFVAVARSHPSIAVTNTKGLFPLRLRCALP